VADIRLALSVDSSGAVKSIKTFNDEVDKTPGVANKASQALKDMASSFASGIGIGAGIETFRRALGSMESLAFGAARALGTYSDQIVTLGQRTGLTVSSLQVFNAIAKTSGTDVDSLAKAAVKMEVAINKGDDSFKKLGLSLSELKAMAPDAAFAKVSTAIGGIEDPMQRAAAAVAVFGKAGAEMLPVFATNMEQAKKQAEDFGLVLSDRTMTAAESLGDAIDLLEMSASAFMMRLAGLVAQSPAVMGAVEAISRAFGSMSKSVDGNQSVFDQFIEDGIGYMERFALGSIEMAEVVIEAFHGVKLVILGLADTFLAMNKMLPTGALLPIDKWRADLAQLAGATADANTKQINALEAMHGKMEKLIQDQHALGFSATQGGGKKGGGGSFDGSTAAESVMKPVWEDVLQKWEAQFWAEQRKFEAFKEQMFNDLPKAKDYWKSVTWKNGIDMLSDADKNREVYTFTKNTVTAAQALQNFANIAALSTSKLGKALAQVFGSGSGLASGLTAFKGAQGFLNKLGAVGSIASAGLGIVSGIVGLFKKKPKEVAATAAPASASAASWASFTGDQQSKGAAGVLAGVSGIKVTSAADMSAQASIASQSFWAMFKEQGLIKAADAFKAVRDKMLETFKAAGASDESVGAMLGGISSMVDLAGNDAFRGAADGANGFSQALASIANQQLPMTLSQFRAYEQQAVAGFEQMKQAALDQGLSMQDALVAAAQGSGQFLTTLQDAAKKYGFDLSGGTQGLLDQANAAGVSFGTSSQDRLIMSLDALTETLGGAPPRFEQAITNAGGAVGARIGQGNTGVNGGKELNADGIGESTADALTPGLEATAKAIVQGISAAFAALPTPNIVLDSGALAGAVAGAINSGYTGVTTALDGH